jgi:signal peptidase I
MAGLMKLVEFLSWLAIPVSLICIVDDWVIRPRRHISSAAHPAPDPPLMKALYAFLPVLIFCAVLRLLVAERLDFSVVLLSITFVTGVVWWLDTAVFRRHREAAAVAAGKEPHLIPEPGTVDYARSFFPVALIVLLLRSFVFEPFRIPSDSMMPTLLDGDFIIVNKYAYGLRLPVLHDKVVSISEPQRGDVVVFRYPKDPSINYIKRLVGLPGDHVEVRDDRLYVNGTAIPFDISGDYSDGCYMHMQLVTERLGKHEHQVLACPYPIDRNPDPPLTGCTRKSVQGYVCSANPAYQAMFLDGSSVTKDVPPGMYLMVGDNRDNSDDGRFWGFVPEDHLVGKATRIWFNWDLQRSGGPLWKRIGHRIE